MRKIYIFDMDGTLIDSMPRFAEGILHVLDEERIPYNEDMLQIVTPLGYRKSAELYVKMGVKDSVEHIVKRIEQKMVYEYTYNIGLKPDVKEYLEKLQSEGAEMYVLTASPHIVTDVCLQRNGIYDMFRKVWTVDDFGLTKSDVQLFYEVAREIGCQPEEIRFFDDNLTAVRNAKKAGYQTYGVNDRHTEEEQERMKQAADYYIHTYRELLLNV